MANHWELMARGIERNDMTALILWNKGLEYFKWMDSNPIVKKTTVKSGKMVGLKMEDELPRAYSIKSMCLHLGISEEYLKSVYKSNDPSNEYYVVVAKLIYIIYTQNLEMAMVGEFNPIMASRLLGLGTEEDMNTGKVTIEVKQGLPKLETSEADVLKNLNIENGKMILVNAK